MMCARLGGVRLFAQVSVFVEVGLLFAFFTDIPHVLTVIEVNIDADPTVAQ